jgi:hypothetical protein
MPIRQRRIQLIFGPEFFIIVRRVGVEIGFTESVQI